MNITHTTEAQDMNAIEIAEDILRTYAADLANKNTYAHLAVASYLYDTKAEANPHSEHIKSLVACARFNIESSAEFAAEHADFIELLDA